MKKFLPTGTRRRRKSATRFACDELRRGSWGIERDPRRIESARHPTHFAGASRGFAGIHPLQSTRCCCFPRAALPAKLVCSSLYIYIYMQTQRSIVLGDHLHGLLYFPICLCTACSAQHLSPEGPPSCRFQVLIGRRFLRARACCCCCDWTSIWGWA